MQNLNTFYPGSVEGVVSAFVSCVFLSNLVVRVVVSAEKKTRLIKLTFWVLIVSKKVVIFQQETTCFQSLKRVNPSTKRADYTKIDYESKNPSFKQTTMFVFEKEKACTKSN